jgi:hypothetical protein
MDTLELSPAERDALRALWTAQDRAHPEAFFEHDHRVVRQRGTEAQAEFAIDREILRRLRHRGLLAFNRTKAPRWVFRVEPSATEFTV